MGVTVSGCNPDSNSTSKLVNVWIHTAWTRDSNIVFHLWMAKILTRANLCCSIFYSNFITNICKHLEKHQKVFKYVKNGQRLEWTPKGEHEIKQIEAEKNYLSILLLTASIKSRFSVILPYDAVSTSDCTESNMQNELQRQSCPHGGQIPAFV